MKRREFLNRLGVSAAVGAAALSPLGCTINKLNTVSEGRRRPPNIIFIMSDDVPRELISCYGSFFKDYCKTPNIDRLAAQGIRFDHMFTMQSLCSPTRASILTGQYPHHHQVTGLNTRISPELPWVSEGLQKAGYQTALFSKWHILSRPKGFDDFAVQKGQGDYWDPTFYTPERLTKKGFTTEVTTEMALQWLDHRDVEKPFCLFLWHKTPHGGFSPDLVPEKYRKVLEDVDIPEPGNLHENVEKTGSRFKRDFAWRLTDSKIPFTDRVQDRIPREGKTEDQWRSEIYQFYTKGVYRQVAAVDDSVGRILDYVDQENLTDDTMVIYTADQGYMMGQHGMYEKRPFFEESSHMPFIVRYPKAVKPGSANDDICVCTDIPATFLDVANARDLLPDIQGNSLLPLLSGKTPDDWRKSFFFEHFGGDLTIYGVRTKRYKYFRYVSQDKEEEFYDLKNDPEENINQAYNPSYIEAVKTCREETTRLMKELKITKAMAERKEWMWWKEPTEDYDW